MTDEKDKPVFPSHESAVSPDLQDVLLRLSQRYAERWWDEPGEDRDPGDETCPV